METYTKQEGHRMVWGEEGQGLVSRTIAESVRMEEVEVSEGMFRFSFVDLAGAIH